MIDIVIGLVVVYGLYTVYSAYGFCYMLLAYFGFRTVINQVPKLWGWTAINAGDSMWLVDKGQDRMISMGISINERGKIPEIMDWVRKDWNHPKLKLVNFFFLGKAYWRKEKNWNIEDHIRIVTEPIKTKEELRKFLEDYYNQPMRTDISPWELLHIHNYGEDSSVGCLKHHHVLADGLTMSSFVTTTCGQKPQYYVQGKLSNAQFYISMFLGSIMAPYYAIKALLRKEDISAIRPKEKSGIIHTDWTEPRALQPIKDHCSNSGVTINTFLISALVEATRKYNEKYGKCPPEMNFSIPMSLTPFPTDGSTLPMCNNLTFLIWRQKMIPDLEERQKWCNKMLESMKGSLEPVSGVLVIKLVSGVLPHSIAKHIIRDISKTISANFTNVPGPRDTILQNGKDCKQISFMANSAGKISITLGAYSYNDTLTLIQCVDDAVTDDPSEFLQIWGEEIDKIN